MKFIVGNKYSRDHYPPHIVTCRFSTQYIVVLEHTNGLQFSVRPHDVNERYKEYIEPVVHKRYVVWYHPKINSDVVHTFLMDCRPNEQNWDSLYPDTVLLRVDEINYTHDVGGKPKRYVVWGG